MCFQWTSDCGLYRFPPQRVCKESLDQGKKAIVRKGGAFGALVWRTWRLSYNIGWASCRTRTRILVVRKKGAGVVGSLNQGTFAKGISSSMKYFDTYKQDANNLSTIMSDAPPPDRPPYDPKPSLEYASLVGLQAGAIGAFVSAIQNALADHSRGAMGFVTRTGGTIGFFGALKCLLIFPISCCKFQLLWAPRLHSRSRL